MRSFGLLGDLSGGLSGARRAALALSAVAALALPGEPRARAAAGSSPHALPPIVFVSRLPPAGAEAGQVPGLGPHGTYAGSGGKLMERSPDGRVRELLPAGRLHDVADPAVSPDGHEVAFSAREQRDSDWRIWTVPRAGGEPRCRTCDEAGSAQDADPAWWGDTLLFVSTRGGGRALYDGSLVTQLWLLAPDGGRARLTSEPNGVLDPGADRARRQVLFARWWFNPFRIEPPGVAVRGGAAPGDTVNLWQVVSARLGSTPATPLALEDVRLASGGTTPRRSGMGVQPAARPGGGMLVVAARNTGLAPRPGALTVLRFGRPPGRGVRVAGAAIGDDAGDPYREGANLAAPAACSPAPLPDGRFLCALDPGGRGEFGLCLVSADGASHEMLVDEPGRWELDPAVVPVAADVRPARRARTVRVPARATPKPSPTFRYLSRDLFAGAGAPERRSDAVLHVFGLGAGDSAHSIRRVSVPRTGRVDLALPADTPLFEALTDASGRVLSNAHGIAQVRGFNSGAPGSTSRCAGCHLGHSAMPR